MNDFLVNNQGTIFLLVPNTDAARDWIVDHLPGDAMTWGGATVIEHRYIGDILDGIDNDGLTFEWA